MANKTSPSAAPAETLVDKMKALSPDELRAWVKASTSEQLTAFVEEMNAAKEMPDMFQEREMQEAIAKRMEEVDIALDTKDRWEKLRTEVGKVSATVITAEDEKSFLEKMKEKGGISYYIGSAAIAILAFFGVKKAKALQESVKGKGFLRTAIEGAKEHPIFTAFLAAIGIKGGTEAYAYLQENKEGIEKGIKEVASKTGASIASATDVVAERAKEYLAKGYDAGLKGLAKGLSFALGGEYDEVTGVVTLPYATLRPPVITAYAAGVRRRMEFSRFFVEDKLKTIVKQTGKATAAAINVMPQKQLLATEALSLMNKGITPGGSSKESIKLERILETLQDDLDLKETQRVKTNVVNEAQLSPDAAKKRIAALEQELANFDRDSQPAFKDTRDKIMEKMKDADTKLKNGNYANAESMKKITMDEVNAAMRDYQDAAVKGKAALGNQLVDTINGLSASGGGMDIRGRQQLDRVVGGGTKSVMLERATGLAEKAGCRIARNPLGKLIVKGVAIHSLMPLAIEGAAALRMGKEGEAARKAVMIDGAEVGLGFVPGIGEALDIKAAATGKDLNGRDLSTNQRIISGVMGGLGTVSIGLGFFTGGLSIAGFKVLRGMVGTAKAVKNIARGTRAVDAVDSGIDAVRLAQREADLLKGVSNVSDLQKTAIKAKKYVDNTQRLAQLGTYAQLGCQLYEGVSWFATDTQEAVEKTTAQAASGIDAVKNFVNNSLPSSDGNATVS